jgi:hypothetical protein
MSSLSTKHTEANDQRIVKSVRKETSIWCNGCTKDWATRQKEARKQQGQYSELGFAGRTGISKAGEGNPRQNRSKHETVIWPIYYSLVSLKCRAGKKK